MSPVSPEKKHYGLKARMIEDETHRTDNKVGDNKKTEDDATPKKKEKSRCLVTIFLFAYIYYRLKWRSFLMGGHSLR